MAVVHLRIDNRLIHGQVTVSWVNLVGANHIICTNDDVANDPIQKNDFAPPSGQGDQNVRAVNCGNGRICKK